MGAPGKANSMFRTFKKLILLLESVLCVMFLGRDMSCLFEAENKKERRKALVRRCRTTRYLCVYI